MHDLMSSVPPVICILGATATGKTELGVRLAETFHTEIINADSRQIYRHLDIGTAKPTLLQQRRAAHHFIDIIAPDRSYDAAQFGNAARRMCEDLRARRKLPLIVGGSGLYLQAAIDGIFPGPSADPRLRSSLAERAARGGSLVLYDELRRIDQPSAAAIHPRDIARLIRALEVYHLTGQTITALRRRHASAAPALPVIYVGLRCSRDHLHRRIAARIEAMESNGIFEEVETLLTRGYDERCRALQGFGYRHTLAVVRGALSRQEGLRRLTRDTQGFAKRQQTWFRRLSNIHWIDVDELNYDQLHTTVLERLRATRAPVGLGER